MCCVAVLYNCLSPTLRKKQKQQKQIQQKLEQQKLQQQQKHLIMIKGFF